MKKYLLLSLFMTVLLSTAAYAGGPGKGGDESCNGKGPGPMMDDEFDRPMDMPDGSPMHGGGPGMKGGEGPGMKGGFHGDPEQFKKQFNLTDEQISKIDDINLKFKKEHLGIREKMAPKSIELKKLLLEDKIDLKKVEAVLKDLSEYQVQSRLLMIKHRMEIENVLTPEQKKKMRSFHDR